MELKIQSIHFDVTEKLHAFIEKKAAKFEKGDGVQTVEFVLKVVKPETAMNKEVALKVKVDGTELYAEKVCDTFEQAVDECMDSVRRQMTKYKEKQRAH